MCEELQFEWQLVPTNLWEAGRQKGPNLKTPSRAGKTFTICFFKRASSLDKRVGGCRETYFMSASQSHHQSVSFLFTVNQSRRHAILWRQMPWDHRLMSMCLHLQSWNECKIRLSARTTAANYTTDHLRFRNLELIKKKNKSKFQGFTCPKNGPFSVKLKGKWHYNCKGSDSSCLWRSAMMLWNVRGSSLGSILPMCASFLHLQRSF